MSFRGVCYEVTATYEKWPKLEASVQYICGVEYLSAYFNAGLEYITKARALSNTDIILFDPKCSDCIHTGEDCHPSGELSSDVTDLL